MSSDIDYYKTKLEEFCEHSDNIINAWPDDNGLRFYNKYIKELQELVKHEFKYSVKTLTKNIEEANRITKAK